MNKIIWLTGLPCSGKTTIAKILVKEMNAKMLDGDDIRDFFKNYDFSYEGRKKHMLEVAAHAFELSKVNTVVVSLVSPIREVREEIKRKYTNVLEVYVKCSLQECEKRDVKGMYSKARRNEIKNFTGVHENYEEPLSGIFVDTERMNLEQCVEIISEVMRDVSPNLVNSAVYVIREFYKKFKNPCMLWSMGKDSTVVLHLVREAFYGKVPFPIVHIDTGFKFQEMYEYRDKVAKELGLNLIVLKNEDSISEGMSPEKGKIECCNALKTDMLKKVIKDNNFDGVLVAIRRDEHSARNIEGFFSPRDEDFKWIRFEVKDEDRIHGIELKKDTDLTGFNIFPSDFVGASHVRVHPILNWDEDDVWRYIRQKEINTLPLYFSKEGKRYRSVGCIPCTKPVQSDVRNIDEMLFELKTTDVKERDGREQDKAEKYAFQKLRDGGYM